MNAHPDWLVELRDLLDRLEDDDITEHDRVRLNDLLRSEPEARAYFVSYLDVHSWLAWDGGHGIGVPPLADGNYDQGDDNGIGMQGSERVDLAPSAGPPSPFPLLPSCPHPSSPVPHPFATLSTLPVGTLLCYVIAVFVIGGGLLVTWRWKLPEGAQAAARMAQPNPGSLPGGQSVLSVGRVTRMTNFQWADPKVAEYAAVVPWGSKYVLGGGSLEISYRSGVKVVIEGPAEYEIESAAIGFLHYGKAIVQVAKKVEGGKAGANGPSKPSEPGPLRLFSIRLPDAMVTALDADFNVVVDRSGISRTAVTRGKAELGARIFPPNQVVPLEQSEWAWVDPNSDHFGSIICGSDKGPTQVFSPERPNGVPVYSQDKKKQSSSLPEKTGS